MGRKRGSVLGTVLLGLAVVACGEAGRFDVAVTDATIDGLRRHDPWDAEVDDPATRGGRFVSPVGDDGVRYYCSHLESVDPGIAAGRRVRAGRQIGTVGNSGNAARSSPHVHFGLSRPTSAGDWEARRGEVWPYDYLRAWAAGKEITPVLPSPRAGVAPGNQDSGATLPRNRG